MTKRTPTLFESGDIGKFVSSQGDIVRELPEKGTEFTRSDLLKEKPYLRDRFDKMLDANVIVKVRRTNSASGSGSWVYKTRDSVADWIEATEPSDNFLLPCDHHGFINLPDSELYKCKLCGETCKRDEISF